MNGKEVVDFLEHYGVKGMKWGVRRSKSNERTRYKTSPKKLTDDELQSRIRRMETEKRYNELNRRSVGTGEKLTSDILTTVGRNTATAIGTAATIYAVKKGLEKKFGEEVVKNMFPKKK